MSANIVSMYAPMPAVEPNSTMPMIIDTKPITTAITPAISVFGSLSSACDSGICVVVSADI